MLLEAASAALLEASEQAVAEAAAAAAAAAAVSSSSSSSSSNSASSASSPSPSRWPAALALGASRWSLVGLIGRAAAPEVGSGGEGGEQGLECWPLDCDAA